MLFSEKIFTRKRKKKTCCFVANTPPPPPPTNQQQQFNNNNNNNNNEFPNVHAEKVVDVYIPERVSRAETHAEEKSVGRVVVVVIIVKEERMC